MSRQALAAIAEALSDWLTDYSPGWSTVGLQTPVTDYAAEIERHEVSAAWLRAHGFDATDYHRAIRNLQTRRGAEQLGIAKGSA